MRPAFLPLLELTFLEPHQGWSVTFPEFQGYIENYTSQLHFHSWKQEEVTKDHGHIFSDKKMLLLVNEQPKHQLRGGQPHVQSSLGLHWHIPYERANLAAVFKMVLQ